MDGSGTRSTQRGLLASSMRGKTGQQLDSGKWVVAFLKKFPIPMMAKAKNLKVSGNV